MESGSIFTLAAIAIFASGIIFLGVLIARSIVSPKKISGIKKLIKQGKYAQAAKLAKSIVSKNPKDSAAHYYLAKAYLLDGKAELALMEFKTVEEHAVFGEEISELEFRKDTSQLYLKFNQTTEALKEFLLLTKLDPSNADYFFNAGKLYEQKERVDLAMGFYKKAILLDKRHVKAHAAMGMAYLRAKQVNEAKKEIDVAIKLSPESFANYYYQGKILKEAKDYPAAVAAFEKAVRDPEYRQRALIERGTCYMAANSLDNAILEFEKAVKYAKSDSSQETLYARYFLASCYEKARKLDDAIRQWEAIMAKNRSFRDVPAKLAEYKDLQSNDALKEYLTAAPDSFVQICSKTATSALAMSPKSAAATKFGCTITALEQKKEDWMNIRQQATLIQFYRNANPVEDGEVRRVADEVKEQNYSKAILCSSSDFTNSAIAFAENRPIMLVGKNKLEEYLASAGL